MGYLTLILGRLTDKNATLVVYNAYGENVSGFFHKGKAIEKGTRKFNRLMKKWRKTQNNE